MISARMKILPLVLAMGIMLWLCGCDERKSTPVGGSVIDRDDVGHLGRVPPQTALRDAAYQIDVSLLTSPYLLVGEWNGYQTKALLQFQNWPDSIIVEAAELWLVTSSVIDTEVFPWTVSDELVMTVSSLETAWDEENISFENIPNATQISSVTTSRADDDTVKCVLPLDIVQTWIDGLDSVSILLSYDGNPGFIRQFYSNNTETAVPRLRLTWPVSDTSDTASSDTTLALTPTSDLFVLRRTTGWPFDTKPDQLMVGSGTGNRCLLQFDIGDTIPSEATVITAPLTLHVDHDFVFFEQLSLGVYVLTDSSWADPQFDATQIAWKTVSADSDSVVLDVRTAVQSWVNGTRTNHGVLVRSLYEYYSITSFVFHSRESDDPDLRPKLEIQYVTPPDFSPRTVVKGPDRER